MTRQALRALIPKEVHHLLPLVYGLLALEVFSVIQLFADQSPDELSWFYLSFIYNPEISGSSLFLYLIGIVGSFLMFSHEREQKSLHFLWTLPVQRVWIIAVKLGVVFAALTLFLVVSELLSWWIHTLSASASVRDAFTPSLWFYELFLLIGLQAIGIAHGALASYFRTGGILVLVFAFFASGIIGLFSPGLDYLSVARLMQFEFAGTAPLLNVKAWSFHGAVAVLSTGIAIHCWTRKSDTVGTASTGNRLGARLLTAGTWLLAIILVIGFATSRLLPPEFADPLPGEQLRVQRTEHFEFSFYDTDREFAELVIRNAAELRREAIDRLGAGPDETVVVNMTDVSADHLGIAGWQRLRIHRGALRDPAVRDHVFIHEFAHVAASHLADRRLRHYAGATRFFNEGLAEWVAFEVLGLEAERRALHRLAALAWERHDLSFADLVHWYAFQARFDEDLAYAVGLSWVTSLVEVCGPDAPAAILHAMGRDDLSQRMSALQLWQDVMRHAGCSLTEVNNRLESFLSDTRWRIDAIPTWTESVSVQGGIIVLEIRLAEGAAETYDTTVRIRNGPDAPRSSQLSYSQEVDAGASGTFTFPRDYVSGHTFQYQVGIEFEEDERAWFGRWIEHRL